MDKVKFPTFEIFDNVSIKISNIRARRFDLIERSNNLKYYYICY